MRSTFGDDISLSDSLDVDSLVGAGVDVGSSVDGVKVLGGAVSSGATLGGAIGTAVPIIGNVVGAAVGSVVGGVVALGSIVANALHGQCTITVEGLDSDCRDYPEHVKIAAQWLKDNPDKAVGLDPHTFSVQSHILVDDFIDWFNGMPGDWGDYRDKIRGSGAWDALQKLPGTKTLLRMVQIPAAAAVAAATPELLSLYKTTFSQSFPALSPEDIAKIAIKVQPLLDAKIHEMSVWIAGQPMYPSFSQVSAAFPLLQPIDVNRVMAMTPASTSQIARSIGNLHGAHTMGPQPLQLTSGIMKKGNTIGPQLTSTIMKSGLAQKVSPPMPPMSVLVKEKWWQRLLEKVHLRKRPINAA